MGKDDEISKAELLETGVEVGAAVGASLAVLDPLTAAGIVLATKFPGWVKRVTGARAQAWWNAFLKACEREDLDLEEMRDQIAAQMESDPKTADVIMGHMRDVLDTATSEAVAILGSLRGAYYREERAPDGFFRGATELLMQCTETDLEALRELTGRLACIKPTTKSRTIAVMSGQNRNTGMRTFRLAQVELEEAGTPRQDILGVGWKVGPLWKRLQHLLVSTGLARNDGQLYDFIVEHDEMRRLHSFVRRRGIRDGAYPCYRRGKDNSHHAELVSLPACFGYGATPDEALQSLKVNLALFVEDAATAELVRKPGPSGEPGAADD
jgi:predicted RNase H-like HicB family nuclease